MMARKIQLDGVLKLVDVQVDPQVFQKISRSVAGMPTSLKKTNDQLKSAAGNADKLNSRLRTTTQQLSQSERAARLFLQRMAQFAILLPTFATLNRSLQGGVKFLLDFDSALRDIVRIDISGLSDRIEEVGDAALKTARDFGVSAIEVLNTTRIFKQAGFDIEESQEKARAAILATQVSTLNSAQAVEVFIAAQKQFVGEGEDSIAVLDKLAKVEDEAAVNAADVAEAFRTGGNALAEFSQSIDDSIGLIAALREQSRKSGREIGTFFKTIQTRIFAAGESRSALEALGVTVQNLDGSLRPTLDVLNDLNDRFDSLTQAQQANAAKAIAGIRQFESLLATLNSLERANELAASSANAAGTAEDKRRITDEKLERQLGKLIAQGESLAEAVGDAGFEDALTGALKVATKLLESFTGIANITADIGGNLTPLLALGGLTLGRRFFGLSRNGAPGGAAADGQGAAAAGALGKQAQQAIDPLKTQLARLGAIVKSSTAVVGTWTSSVATNLNITNRHGMQINADSQALQTHINAIKSNVNALKQSEAAAIAQGKVTGTNTTVLLGLSLAAASLPAVFKSISEQLRGTNSGLGNFGADLLDASEGGVSLAAQFAVLGPQASAIAFAFGTVQNALLTSIDAIKEETKAREELRQQQSTRNNRSQQISRLTSGTADGGEIQEALIDSLVNAVTDQRVGSELAAGIQKGFQNFSRTTEDFADAADVRETLLGNISVLRTFVQRNKDYIAGIADSNDKTAEFAELLDILARGEASDVGTAFNRLLLTLGAVTPEVSKITGVIEEIPKSFKEFEKTKEVTDFAERIRDLSLELDLAQLGPDALSDSVVRMTQELMLSERTFENTQRGLRNGLGKLFSSLDEFSVGLNDNGVSTAEFFQYD